ncbi:MAG: CDP-diacylglycerol--serine O-phosphatidyltransferase [Desulfobacterales bacterium]|nr:CDP-diacylglycerol--serine O-phosphatidyltransferase [Desulfobacterales bacterium]
MERENLKKGIYILPNFFTSMNIFCGFYAIIASIDARFADAAIAILIGGIFDLLDGKIARATNTTSRFGLEYDSLADLVTFGMAPSLMMILWVLKPMGRLGWVAGFLFMICGALRLARFNTKAGTPESSGNFEGLPIPAAAAMTAITVLLFSRFNIEPDPYRVGFLVMLYCLSFCMVSSIKYQSFKKVSFFNKMKFNWLVGLVLILATVVYEPWIVLFAALSVYVLSGPLFFLYSHHIMFPWQKNKKKK